VGLKEGGASSSIKLVTESEGVNTAPFGRMGRALSLLLSLLLCESPLELAEEPSTNRWRTMVGNGLGEMGSPSAGFSRSKLISGCRLGFGKGERSASGT